MMGYGEVPPFTFAAAPLDELERIQLVASLNSKQQEQATEVPPYIQGFIDLRPALAAIDDILAAKIEAHSESDETQLAAPAKGPQTLKQVGHASTNVRQPHPLARDFFVEPQYPDVNLDELRVELPLVASDDVDTRNPFIALMEDGQMWLDADELLDEVAMVHKVQYQCHVSLNDADLRNMRGLARDIITKPVVDKGVSTRWHDPDQHFIERDPPPMIVKEGEAYKYISSEERKKLGDIALTKAGGHHG